MKKVLLLSLLSTTSIFAFAGFDKDIKLTVSTLMRSAPYQRLVVSGNLKVILVSEGASTVEVIESRESEKVITTYHKNKLVIDGWNVDAAYPVTVKVPVNQLQYLDINGNVSVLSEKNLDTPNLNIIIDGEGKVSLKNKGQITVKSAEDFSLKVDKVKGKVRIVN